MVIVDEIWKYGYKKFVGILYVIVSWSATLVFGYHFDMAKKRILTHNEIGGQMNNSDELSELSEDGLAYSDDNVDFLPDCVSSNEDSDSDCENT
ncbi:hypothetical protein TNIN_167991 [Trichonephila inaurata madagascariensis]|uniref:Uncharacterized protein n=1 Tax=Trichonephila inaurata madagascariensis TaxID=2747483 RepID=A0A8X7BN53_9ARAC|nr:hypothetical protein TNIN_167991 [Trichonephila inaurata madagascariensis]